MRCSFDSVVSLELFCDSGLQRSNALELDIEHMELGGKILALAPECFDVLLGGC
jgi:hypothetical protein